MIKGCIFDLDGTLANTIDSIARAVNLALERYGYEQHPVEKFKFFVGDGMNMAVQRALAAEGETDAKCIEEISVQAREYFAEDPLYLVKPYEGILKMLSELKRRGVRLAVLSNKPHLQAIEVVESIFGREIFDMIQGQEEKIPRKPDPAGIRNILKAWDFTPEDCLYIGDSDTDMKTACAAGMKKIGVVWGFRPQKELEDNGADYIIHHPLELLEIQEEVR